MATPKNCVFCTTTNRIIDFIQSFLTPGRFIGNSSEFEDHRTKLNAILSLSGLDYGKDGKFRRTTVAATLDQAEARLKTIDAAAKKARVEKVLRKLAKA